MSKSRSKKRNRFWIIVLIVLGFFLIFSPKTLGDLLGGGVIVGIVGAFIGLWLLPIILAVLLVLALLKYLRGT